MAPAMPCKRDKQQSSIAKENVEHKNGHEKEFKTMYGCMVEIPRVCETESRIFAIHST